MDVLMKLNNSLKRRVNIMKMKRFFTALLISFLIVIAFGNVVIANEFEKLFDIQIATLKNRGVPEQIVAKFEHQKGIVLKKVKNMIIKDKNIPFLPVIPQSFRSFFDLITMVRNNEKVGHTALSPTAISDIIETPSVPYYIYEIENGNVTIGKSPQDADKIFKSQGRSGLTVAETIALLIHKHVLSEHYVWTTGSRFNGSEVPIIYLDSEDRPILTSLSINIKNSRWGSASCGSR